MDRFLKTCLVLIVVLLTVIALRMVISPSSVQAQGQRKYLSVRVPLYNDRNKDIQSALDKYAADGWELAAPVYIDKDATGNVGELYIIFRK